MAKAFPLALRQNAENAIRTIRDQKVILDKEVAALFGTTTKKLNQAFKRNVDRFPPDFAFQLTQDEVDDLNSNLRSQFVTSSDGHGGRRYRPYAFTEHGVVMVAGVL